MISLTPRTRSRGTGKQRGGARGNTIDASASYNMGRASWRSLVVVVLALSVFVRSSCAQGCPSSCGCFGTFVSCAASGMTRIPVLPLATQQTVEELNLMGNMIVSIFAEDLANYTSLRDL